MRVYQLARELGKLIDEIVCKISPRLRRIADHMARSMESAGLNLAEGLSAYRPGIKANAFEISRKETGEVRKAVERAFDNDGITKRDLDQGMALSNSFIAIDNEGCKEAELANPQFEATLITHETCVQAHDRGYGRLERTSGPQVSGAI